MQLSHPLHIATTLIAGVVITLLLPTSQLVAQNNSARKPSNPDLMLETEAVGPQRFIAAHGRRALIDGYATRGLEVWAYPFQILSGYRIAFRASGTTTPINGSEILSRVIYEPTSITRVYVGPDFIVHEKLFVPLNLAGAIVTYSIACSHGLEIDVNAMPVLNLMWPAAIGGQSVAWNPALSAFVLSEPANGYSATVGSPQIVAHDDIGNRTTRGVSDTGVAFTLRADSKGAAGLYVALNSPHTDPGMFFNRLMRDHQQLEADAETHQAEYENQVLRVQTPDIHVNQAIAWAEIALDQAWVCNPDLGCGFVAGYGPSRGARRPQYDWFFAGDGLIAADGSMTAGDPERAREELEFILHYQDAKTGMIWHELSQSAGFLDWVGKYPYMFVHVDITFQLMGTLARYVSTSGDIDFIRKHWSAIAAAYHYCESVIDPATGLPRIPANKEGGNEQDRMSDDLGLSTSWVDTTSAFAQLATLSGYTDLAKRAKDANDRARSSIPNRYWDAQHSFWISGHTMSGQAMAERRSSPTEALTLNLFTPEQSSTVLDQITSSSFQTDWGTRGIGTGSVGFDPESYAKGSISALHTGGIAQALWSAHRPVAAVAVWRALLPWTSLDSLGHIHEVLAGNFYRAQVESVPEQTWSSAGFIDATIHGLLGIQVDAIPRHLLFAPRIPAEWNDVSITHLRIASASEVSLSLHRTTTGITFNIDNHGDAFRCDFNPELALGARLGDATFNGRKISATIEQHEQETNAHVVLEVPRGKSELRLNSSGGVRVSTIPPMPHIGKVSRGLHIIGVHLDGRALTIDADVPSTTESYLQLQTVWTIATTQGAIASSGSMGTTRLTFTATGEEAYANPYHRARAVVEFRP